MEKRVITSEEFINKFIECLREKKDFELWGYIVNGDITSEMIKEKLKENGLNHLIKVVEEGYAINSTIEVEYIIVDVKISIFDVDFNGN